MPGGLATALAMQRTLEDLNGLRPHEPDLQLRIGINSGRVIAGDIGSPLHKAYTVIGDVVNIASRLETSVALPGQIVIGEATYEQAGEHFACEPLGEVQLRGKRQAIRAYRVIGPRGRGGGVRTGDRQLLAKTGCRNDNRIILSPSIHTHCFAPECASMTFLDPYRLSGHCSSRHAAFVVDLPRAGGRRLPAARL